MRDLSGSFRRQFPMGTGKKRSVTFKERVSNSYVLTIHVTVI